MIGAPFLVLGLLLVLGALVGARVVGEGRGVLARIILSPIDPATWRAALAIFLGFWVELLAFALFTSAVSVGASLLVVGVGVVIFGIAIEGARLVARVERRRAMLADPRPLRPHAYRDYGSGLQDLLLAVFVDGSRWRDVVYLVVAFPLAVLELMAVVVLWTLALALLSAPLWYATSSAAVGTVGLPIPPAWAALLAGAAGVVLAPIAGSVTQGLMTLHRAVVAGLLCESEERALARRVETLEGSRKAVLDVEASELRRIERDLHDGAQQRLVGLTIDLSLAADRIEADPAGARVLVEGARDQARLALAELRDLVRGIAPAILLDRGLVAALGALAGRSPVPTAVVSSIPERLRLPDAVERSAYFVVGEALANVAKHAAAARCEIRVRGEGTAGAPLVVVEVWDDGAGGATIVPGGGLAGLVGRVEALDGTLAVESPAGGPTTVRATIPFLLSAATMAPPTAEEQAAPAPIASPVSDPGATAPPADQDPR